MKKLEKLRCTARRLPVILLAAVFLLTALPGAAAEPTPPEPEQTTTPPPATAIPLAEVATQATELATLLHTLTTNLAPSPEIETIQQALPDISRRIDQEFAGTMSLLQQQPTLETLQAQQQSWQRQQLQVTGRLNLITQRAIDLREALSRLATLQATWSRTLDAARATSSPEPLLQQIEAALAAIKAVQAPLQAQQVIVLDLQGRVAGELARCNDALSQIAQAQRRTVGGLLTRALPIWSAELWLKVRTEGVARLRQLAVGHWAEIEQYLDDSAQNLPLHLGIFIVMTVLMVVARRQVQRWTAADKRLSFTTTVFDHPYAAAFIATLVVVSAPNLPTPPTVRNLFLVVGLIPMIRLVRPVMNPRLVHGLYALGVLYALDTVREAFAGAPLVEQVLMVLETLLGMAVLGWALAGDDLRRPSARNVEVAWLNTLRAGAALLLLVLAAGLLSSVLGYLRLARLLVSSVLGGGFLALVLAASVQVLGGLLALVLHVWPLRRLQLVRHHRSLLERRGYRLLVWLAVIGWLARWLDYIGLFQPAWSFLGDILSARFERGSISLSLGDMVAFLLTLWTAYLLSTFLRFVLQEEVYPRKGMSRGSSYAISNLLHYAILTLGFLVGLGILGMDFTKVSVLLGALGVGIGFGLQSVVNNFISGLILLFERPIHVGDIIQVDNLQGEVRRIGIRASTVRTDKGADIIVPNGQFISGNVTNWTLNDQLQRLDVPVTVTYRAAVHEVVQLLETLAAADPRVLARPAPQGLLISYGEKSLNFELRVWTDRYDDAPTLRSDLIKAVYEALIAAGMAAPLPQGEILPPRDLKSGASSPSQPEERATPAGQKRDAKTSALPGHASPKSDEG